MRDYLISELEGLGLSPEVQKSFVTNEWFGRVFTGNVENIIARIPGTDNSKAVMIAGIMILYLLARERQMVRKQDYWEQKRLLMNIHGLKTLDSCLILKRAGTKVSRLCLRRVSRMAGW